MAEEPERHGIAPLIAHSAAEAEAMIAAIEAGQRAEQAQLCAAVLASPLPVLWPAGNAARPTVVAWGADPDAPIDCFTLEGGPPWAVVAVRPGVVAPREVAIEHLADALHDWAIYDLEGSSQDSGAWRQAWNDAEATALAATPTPLPGTIAGTPVTFELRAPGRVWAAGTGHDDLVVVVAGADPAPTRLDLRTLGAGELGPS